MTLFVPVASGGTKTKKSPAAQKSFSPKATVTKMSVRQDVYESVGDEYLRFDCQAVRVAASELCSVSVSASDLFNGEELEEYGGGK